MKIDIDEKIKKRRKISDYRVFIVLLKNEIDFGLD